MNEVQWLWFCVCSYEHVMMVHDDDDDYGGSTLSHGLNFGYSHAWLKKIFNALMMIEHRKKWTFVCLLDDC